MKEIKNKKTGKIDIIDDVEFEKIKNHKILKHFIVTDLKIRPLIPSLKQVIVPELKKPKKR